MKSKKIKETAEDRINTWCK